MRLLIAWRNLLAKPVQSGLTVLIVAATIAMLAWLELRNLLTSLSGPKAAQISLS
ncbi:hypothetical protein [Pelosinus baikalensis]|uniref:Uncharacterized protein n=1 Tax=Pelosinus baikalensis TaxID=2892015 RepID=A0ABS8HQP9_9FIRM|nr:hypothetical protein [Pelosinus baikalensis]MCC5465496.1 hypothetical protein [Pelosinus baikalensis]